MENARQDVVFARTAKESWRDEATGATRGLGLQIACFNPTERQAFEDSLKNYRDCKGITETAHEEGLEQGLEQGRDQGMEEGRVEVARRLMAKGMTAAEVAEITGISAVILMKGE